MLEIPIILDLYGKGSNRKTVGTIKIVNDGTGTRELGNYVVFFENERGSTFLKVEIKNFARLENDAFDLLKLALIKGIK